MEPTTYRVRDQIGLRVGLRILLRVTLHYILGHVRPAYHPLPIFARSTTAILMEGGAKKRKGEWFDPGVLLANGLYNLNLIIVS